MVGKAKRKSAPQIKQEDPVLYSAPKIKEKIEDPQDFQEISLQRKSFKPSVSLKITLLFIVMGTFLSILSHLVFFQNTLLNNFKIEMVLLCIAPLLYIYSKYMTHAILQRNALLEQHDLKSQRLNNIYHMITQINHSVLRERSQEQLLSEACRIAQKSSHYTFVWAGLCESNAPLPDLIVSHGENHDYIQALLDGYSNASALERQEPALTALRKKQTVVINDIVNFSKNPHSWQTRALEYDFHAIAAFALKTTTGLNGLFALYSKEKDAFSQEEVYLLRTLVDDLNLGLSEIAQKDQLVYAANFDLTTNLPTQSLFMDRLQQSLARTKYEQRIIALAIVKPIPSMLESKMQDEQVDSIFKNAATHLMHLVREGDTVGFIGKNEIGILLTDVASENDLPNVMGKLLTPYYYDETEIILHAGVAIAPKDTTLSSELLQYARSALDRFDQSSDILCHFYTKELTYELRNNQRIKSEMSSALVQEEFVLYFQPILDLQTKKLKGLEVLTRWPNQKLGDVSPNQFFGVAEETGLVIPLGNWILKTACDQFKQWEGHGHGALYLCVNISIKQLEDPLFVDNVKKILKEAKWDPKVHKLCFEIKEQCFANNYDAIKETLVALRNLGIMIYLDDYTKDAQLMGEIHQFAIDALKVDAMTVRTIGKNPNTDLLIRGIVAYAKGLNLQIIAEGIETQEQFDFLKEVGCQQGQGYYFNPPLIAKNAQALLLNPLE